MTACSNNRPKVAKKVITTQQQKPKKLVRPPQTRQVYQKPRSVPVIFEKRSPQKVNTKQRHRQRTVRRITPPRAPVIRNYSFASNLSSAALSRLRSRVRYDGSYVKIAYPWGDVPANIGVCTDVVIRSYRKLGIDLQQQVHNDMSAAFNAYPNIKKWGLSKPDANIDHRRVYNLRAFLARRGAALPITHNPRHYKPGDLVTWMVGKNLPHIGVVVNRRSKADPSRYMIVHNIAYGPQIEDVLFAFPITGHYRYTPDKMRNIPKPSYVSNKAKQRSNAMDYAQLMQAAKILGTHSSKTTKTQRSPRASKKIKPIILANLTDTEIRTLLK